MLDIFLGGATADAADDWFQAEAKLAVAIVICVFLAFDLGSLSLVGQLVLFHLKLRRMGLTTYKFIVQDNQRRREETKLANELEQKRASVISRARGQGQSCYVFRLQCGGTLRKTCGLKFCDPLQITDLISRDGQEAEGGEDP